MTETAQIYVRKEAAAQRQLDAAIRMMLANEDDLAIHTLAAAAYQIIRDLKEKKHGRGELRERFALGLFLFAKDLASGKLQTLPPEIGPESLRKMIYGISDRIKRGEVADGKGVLTLLNISVAEKNAFWSKFNLPAGFLKHADRQPSATLALDELSNDLLLMQATTAYVELMGTETPEMLAYFIYRGGSEDLPPKLRDIVKLPSVRRRRACLLLLRDLKKRGDAALFVR